VDEKQLVRTSKYLSKHLRHQPGRLGVELEPGGWVRVDDLLAACRRNGMEISVAELEEVVARNDKRRFGFDASRTRIRANQGHSVSVDLQLAAATLPAVLFHGTHPRAVDAIMREGLLPQGRHHVHLSADVPTASRVGARRGKPVVLEVAAAAMSADAFEFFLADNGVWLADTVPPRYLRRLHE
jgi:putative RNA 2'-phosphotransferase